MKQEILFRGKLNSNGKWVYGMPSYDLQYIFNDENLDSPDNFEVNSKTIGQFSTITDKKGTKIFDGDLFKLGAEKDIFEVKFEHGCFLAYRNGKQYGLVGELHVCFIDVVGNIFDNPELIKAAS